MTVTEIPRDILTQAEAEARAARVSGAAYQLVLDLARGAEGYQAEVTIRFSATGSADLFLDFRGKRIQQLQLNGTTIRQPSWNGYRLTLPGELLRADNEVWLAYQNDSDPEGDGFHQFTDPEDG